MAEEPNGRDYVHKVLFSKLQREGERRGLDPIWAKKIDVLFRSSEVVPVVRHPKQIMAHLKRYLGKKRRVTNRQLFDLVNGHLAREGARMHSAYWVLGREMPTDSKYRMAFSPNDMVAALTRMRELDLRTQRK